MTSKHNFAWKDPGVNRQWRVAARPTGALSDENFMLSKNVVPRAGPGQFVVRTLFLSLAPVMRQYMIDGAGIEPPLAIGDLMYGRGVGQVIESRSSEFAVGEIVHGKLGWQEYACIDRTDEALIFRFRAEDLPPSLALGALGVTGFSAFVGLYDFGKPKAGETVLVLGAAGGVGSVVGPLARIAGCRTIGVAGTAEKCAMLRKHLHYDAAINYKSDGLSELIEEAAPQGVDVIFDNVGGRLLDAGLDHLNRFGRVVCCGRISQYLAGPEYRLANWWRIGKQRAAMSGFFVYDHVGRFAEAEQRMAQWIREGQLPYLEDILDGIEQMPSALQRLFDGKNIGKQLVRVADPLPLQ